MSETQRKKLIDLILLGFLAAALLFLAKKALFLILPVFLAFLFAEGVRSSMRRLSPLKPMAKRILTVLFLLIFFAFLSLLAVLLAERLLHYGTFATEELSKKINPIFSFCKEKNARLEESLSLLLKTDLSGRFTSYLPTLFQNVLARAVELIPAWIGGILAFLPRFFLSMIIFLVSCYYFSCDREKVLWPFRYLSKEKKEKLAAWKKLFFLSLRQYVTAYLLLFLLSFSGLFLGLVLLGFRGAFGIALLIALIDLLPVLGCGTVLIPWSLISFFSGDQRNGISLLILYLILLLARQFAEPKILGKSIGLHPLFSLLLVLAGLSFFGLPGMILLPLLGACLCKAKEKNAE